MARGTKDTKTLTLTSQSDLSAKQYLFAKISTDNGCDLAGAGEDAIGTIFNGGTASGQGCTIDIGPVVLCTLNATLTAGAEVMSDANHKAVAWTTGNRSLGYLIEGGAAGEQVAMFFTQNGRKA